MKFNLTNCQIYIYIHIGDSTSAQFTYNVNLIINNYIHETYYQIQKSFVLYERKKDYHLIWL